MSLWDIVPVVSTFRCLTESAVQFYEGNYGYGLLKLGETAVSLACDVATISSFGATTVVTKTATKVGIKSLAKQVLFRPEVLVPAAGVTRVLARKVTQRASGASNNSRTDGSGHSVKRNTYYEDIDLREEQESNTGGGGDERPNKKENNPHDSETSDVETIEINEPGNSVRRVVRRKLPNGKYRTERIEARVRAHHLDKPRTNFSMHDAAFRALKPQLGDERGHIIASSLGGPAEAYNLTPQSRGLNRDVGFRGHPSLSWFKIERYVREHLQEFPSGVAELAVVLDYGEDLTTGRAKKFRKEVKLYKKEGDSSPFGSFTSTFDNNE